jgi:single-stranded DNA-binding protein
MIMDAIEAAFEGRVGKAGELRTSQSGKVWCSLSVVVGKDEAATWLSVAVVGDRAEAAAAIEKGARVYVEGRLTLNTWKASDGTDKTGLKVAASLVQPLGQIGHRKPGKRQDGASGKTPSPGARRTYDAAQRPLEERSARGRGWGDSEIPF